MSAVVLIVEDDQNMRRALVRMFARHEDWQVETADNGTEGLAAAERITPDLIVSDYNMPGLNGFELCTRVKGDPALRDAMFVVLTGFSDTALKIKGLDLGVDDYLTKPVEAPEFLAKIRAVLRIKELHDQLRADKIELTTLHERLSGSFDRLLQTMVRMMGLKVTGSTERGAHLAQHALTIARRMDVPDQFLEELSLGAQLHEIGRLTTAEGTGRTNPWGYLVASRAILEPIDQLAGVAELVAAIGEHWDGTGGPSHLMQGQIPLRSRILRALIDLFATTADGNTSTVDGLEQLGRYAGTRYDPLVVAHVKDSFSADPAAEWRSDRAQITLAALRAGMVLAEDLVTSSGVKLLSRGATMTDSTIDLILERHQNDPILYGAWIEDPA